MYIRYGEGNSVQYSGVSLEMCRVLQDWVLKTLRLKPVSKENPGKVYQSSRVRFRHGTETMGKQCTEPHIERRKDPESK